MRSACWLCLLILFGVQQGGRQPVADPYSLDLVRGAMDRLSNGVGTGFDARTLVPLGDRFSVSILKIVDQRKLSDPKLAITISKTIHGAFQMPEYIQAIPDRQPQVSLFLLNYLKEKVTDASAQREIQNSIEFVEHQAQASPAAPDSNLNR